MARNDIKTRDMEEIEEKKEVEADPANSASAEEVDRTPQVGRVKAFWAAKFPDRTYATDEEFDGMMADYLEDSDKRLSAHAKAEETFRSVANDHPELLDVIEDLAKDKEMTIIEALYRNVDPDEFLPEEGAPEFDRMRKARSDRMSRQQEAEAFRKKLTENYEKSRGIVSEYFSKNNISPEEQKALGDYIDRVMDDYTRNLITAEVLDAFRRSMNYSKDVASAREVGTIEGKNAKIDAQRQRRAEETDGLPSAGSSAGVSASAPIKKDFLDTILERSEARRNWDK